MNEDIPSQYKSGLRWLIERYQKEMATSKGPGMAGAKEGMNARGYSPMGHGPHGGHHRHEPKQVSVNPIMDAGRNNPEARHSITQPPHAGPVAG